eukprot:TRINITY_DN3675_c0_g1_i3.p1 TRINITY_DN3675_c0_g1~~TRINITY_DN3675_c0_g1_i3.p1  ORF type:complete len:200 (+),score=9.65 TRINITY_DN3675_c0_g1_i3:567-1166(+)
MPWAGRHHFARTARWLALLLLLWLVSLVTPLKTLRDRAQRYEDIAYSRLLLRRGHPSAKTKTPHTKTPLPVAAVPVFHMRNNVAPPVTGATNEEIQEHPHTATPLLIPHPLVANNPADSSIGVNAVQQQKRAWLSIGIPTLPRPGNQNYLRTTIGSYVREITQHGLENDVIVHIVRNGVDPHPVFDGVEYLQNNDRSRW